MVAEEDIEGDGDALAAALAATRSSSVLPFHKFSQSQPTPTELSSLPGMTPISGAGSSGTARKRKERTFTVSGTGTGSSEGGSGPESGASVTGEGDADSNDGNQDTGGVEKEDQLMNDLRGESQIPVGFKGRSRTQIDSENDVDDDADVEDGSGTQGRSSKQASSRRIRSSSQNAERDPNLVWAEQTREALEELQEKELPSPEGIVLVNHSKAARYLAAQCQVSLSRCKF